MAVTVVFWHMPRWYELALNSPAWHGVEHACSSMPPCCSVAGGWRLAGSPAVVALADDPLSGAGRCRQTPDFRPGWFFNACGLSTYELAPRLGDLSALDDQTTAGAIMWVPGSIAFLIPAFVLTMQALNGARSRLSCSRHTDCRQKGPAAV